MLKPREKIYVKIPSVYSQRTYVYLNNYTKSANGGKCSRGMGWMYVLFRTPFVLRTTLVSR